jgi:hypothetical protein
MSFIRKNPGDLYCGPTGDGETRRFFQEVETTKNKPPQPHCAKLNDTGGTFGKRLR